MAKSKAKKSPKKSAPTEPLCTPGQKIGHGHRKNEVQQPEPSDDDDLDETATDTLTLKIPAHVVWDKYPEHMERLLDYLDTHPDIAIKLFGDSTQSAKLEGHSKLTTKSNKASAYLQLADGIFSLDDDPAIQADFMTNPNKYAKAVDNYITNT